jgi:hypothetical protein
MPLDLKRQTVQILKSFRKPTARERFIQPRRRGARRRASGPLFPLVPPLLRLPGRDDHAKRVIQQLLIALHFLGIPRVRTQMSFAGDCLLGHPTEEVIGIGLREGANIKEAGS